MHKHKWTRVWSNGFRLGPPDFRKILGELQVFRCTRCKEIGYGRAERFHRVTA